MTLHFVTGKGGSGKTRVSILLHRLLKSSVVSESSGTGLLQEAKAMGQFPVQLHPFKKEILFQKFLEESIKISIVRKLIATTSTAQTLLHLAPNLYELLLLREWIRLAESQDLIVDAPSSGNFLSLIDCPKTAIRVFDGGSMRAIADEVEAFFQTRQTVVHIVTLPENSSLQEMRHIENEIQSKYPIFRIKRILNRLHTPTAPIPELSDRLQRLQLNRPIRERERTKLDHFEHQILEGAVSL